jgi:iron(III) transport system permease protein
MSGSMLVTLVLVLPLIFLIIEANGVGASSIGNVLWRPLTGELLWNTIRLTAAVTALSAVIGTLAAWCVERTDLPFRRLLSVLLVLPFAIPDFVVSFGWISVTDDQVRGYFGAVLVMTLAVYPLVYLPVAAGLRSANPGLEETARGLGFGPIHTFFRVTLGQVRTAILGGCVLVCFVLLAEYGAFEMLGFQTFTTEIITELQTVFDLRAACSLSLILVGLSLVVLTANLAAEGRIRPVRVGALAQRTTPANRLGGAKVPVLLGIGILIVAALGIPVGASVHLMIHTSVAGGELIDAVWHTGLYGICAATVATVFALPIALLSVRHASPVSRVLERSTYLVLAMPGAIVALALTYFTARYLNLLYQSPEILALAYAILFFPLALVGVRASLIYASVRMEEMARSLGATRSRAFVRVTFPLVAPGIAASFCLVFIGAVTELTATLVLIPPNTQTLATRFWAYQEIHDYAQAAPFAVAMIAIAAIPAYVLSRYFDRLPRRATTQ